MSVLPVLSVILTAANLATNAAKPGAHGLTNASSRIKDKHRWLQCTLRNQTQFHVVLLNTYFDSGRYEGGAGGVGPFEQTGFTLCNKDWSILTGATGGNSFRIIIDGNNHFDFALGWTNPEDGGFKAGVVESSNPEDGYNNATLEGGYVISRNIYCGKDEDGHVTNFQFHVSACPGQETLYVITQLRIN